MLSLFLSCFPVKKLEQTKPEAGAFPEEFFEEQYFHENHGIQREDPFVWLVDKDSPRVKELVLRENLRFSRQQDSYASLYQELVSEMLKRQEALDSPIEFQQEEWTYISKRAGNYAQIFRQKESGEQEILIDQNELAKQSEFLYLSSWEPAANNQILAYVIDNTGNNQYNIVLYDMEKKEVLKTINEVSENVIWLDESQVLYVSQDERGIQHDVFLYDVSSGETKNLYHETELASRVSIEEADSGQFIFLTSESETGNQILVLDRESEADGFSMLWERQDQVLAFVTQFGEKLLIHTNDQHENYRILEIDSSDFSKQSIFQEASEQNAIQSVASLSKVVVVWEKQGQDDFFRVYDEAGVEKKIAFPITEFIGKQDIYYDYDANTVMIPFPSMIDEGASRAYDLLTGEHTDSEEQFLLDYEPSDYIERDIIVNSEDGVNIPITLLYHKNLDLSSPQPVYLETYGSYGWTFEREFSPYRISLVQRGVLFAYCHTRGSGIKGNDWYEGGSGLNRQNSIDDLVTCGRELQKLGYTSPEKTVIAAESAGGTIVGGAINQAPELWKAAILERPFVDLITVLSDPENGQNPEEWQEWGNPAEKEVFDVMMQYSPYDNIKAQNYPEILVISGWNDPSVQYWEPTKLVGKLRKYNREKSNIFLYTDMTGGHFGAQSNQGIAEDRARIYSFAMNQLGITGH